MAADHLVGADSAAHCVDGLPRRQEEDVDVCAVDALGIARHDCVGHSHPRPRGHVVSGHSRSSAVVAWLHPETRPPISLQRRRRVLVVCRDAPLHHQEHLVDEGVKMVSHHVHRLTAPTACITMTSFGHRAPQSVCECARCVDCSWSCTRSEETHRTQFKRRSTDATHRSHRLDDGEIGTKGKYEIDELRYML